MRDIANTSGTVIDHVVYDSYGDILSETSPSNGDRFKFAGMEFDSTTGIYYDHARYYDPNTGRFVTQDPKAFAAGDTNLYRYVGDLPTGRVDQSGFSGGGTAQEPPGEQNLTDLDLLEEIEKEELLSIDREMTMEGLLSIPPGDYPGERTQMQKDLIEEKNYFHSLMQFEQTVWRRIFDRGPKGDFPPPPGPSGPTVA